MNQLKNILIIGAGDAGKLLKNDIEKNHPNCKMIGFVDDKETSSKNMLVLGKIDELSKINKIYKIDEMIISIPSADGVLIRRILLNNLKNTVPVKIVPRNQKIIETDTVKYPFVKNIDTEDFLGRAFFKKRVESLKNFYKNKTIFVTGGAGSIGSEIVHQLIDLKAKKVIAYDNSEFQSFILDQSLRERKIQQSKYDLVIGSIQNTSKLDYILKKEKPDIIFHAAAYKHVYLMESNIDEAIKNNVIGTKKIVDAAEKNKIKHFVFISTDKVVNPTSIMGATKKLSEYYIKHLEPKSKTKFNIVRFGNVINSKGSVLPLFEKQIEERKKITVTHKKVRRFFMSIREAAQLVISSAAKNTGGEIYILNMGDLINIYDTARCLIRSKNLIPEKDIQIEIIGLKKGEKLIEELYTKNEKKNLVSTKIDNVFRLKNFEKCPIDIKRAFLDLEKIISIFPNQRKVTKYLKNIFPSLRN